MVVESLKSFTLSTCIQLRMTKHPSRKVMNFRHLLSCDTIAFFAVRYLQGQQNSCTLKGIRRT